MNLFPENLPKGTGDPAPVTHYLTAGLILKHGLSGGGPVRGMYVASNGDFYVVGGPTVYCLDANFTETYIGTLTTSTGQVSMIDNTLTLVIVDGSERTNDPSAYDGGMQVDLPTRVASPMPINDDGFYGSVRVDYLATYLLFDKAFSPQFYVSDSLATTFTSLYFANKSSAQDYLASVIAARGYIVLPGAQFSTEVWTLSGASDFPFQELPSILIEQGCIAPHSIAKADGQIYWVSQTQQGRGIVVSFSGVQAKRISTHALEALFSTYALTDAIGYTWQGRGHEFYVLTFPTANATWVYDEATGQWHQWAWTGPDGSLNRHRSNCHASVFGMDLVGDWETGNIFALDFNTPTDNGGPIQRIRSFPHIMNDGKRLVINQFIADMAVDAAGDPGTLNLRVSCDRGASFGDPLSLMFGGTGNSLESLSIRRLGMGRDFVFELDWVTAPITALNGAFIEATEAST